MRLHREVRGTLGEPLDRGIPIIPERWRLPVLIAVLVLCLAIFAAGVLYGLHHG